MKSHFWVYPGLALVIEAVKVEESDKCWQLQAHTKYGTCLIASKNKTWHEACFIANAPDSCYKLDA